MPASTLPHKPRPVLRACLQARQDSQGGHVQARYGSVLLPVNGAEVTSQTTVCEATDYGAPLRYLVAYQVVVYLIGSGQAQLSLLEIALRTELSKGGKDFVLLTDTGQVSSAAILNSQTASGTRVVSISTPEAQGAEFVTRRTIAFVVTAEYHVANSDRAVLTWSESVSILGNGGPARRWRFPVNAPGIRQTVTPSSLVRATQQGHGVGYRVPPRKPLPIWPDYQVNEAALGTIETPKFIGNDYVNYPVSWSYQFEHGDGPLVGTPGLPPGVL
jgi:hypothetical protein